MEQLNPGQIKKNIKQLKQRQEQYLYYLGQLAFHAGEQGKLEDPGMLEAYQTLKDIQVQLAQGEASLEQIKAAKEAAQKPRCPQCGEPLPKGAVFCAKCGSSLTAAPPAAAAPPVAAAAAVPGTAGGVCSSCGAPLDEDAVFCGNCGAKTVAEVAAGAAPAEPAAAAAPATASEEPVPAIEETIACPQCGAAVSEADIQFCSVCGAQIPQAAAEKETVENGAPAQQEAEEAPATAGAEEDAPPLEETHACPKCGAGITDKDVIFCSVCGTKVRE